MKTWSATDAKERLDIFLQTLSLQGEVHLLHFAKAAVFSLPKEGLAVKVSRPSASFESISRAMRFASWLEDRGVPGPRVAEDINKEPFRIEDALVSCWRADNFQVSLSSPELAQALRLFHQEINFFEEELPRLSPLEDIARILEGLEGGSWDKDLPLLWSWHERLFREWGEVPSLLGEGPLHGNVHRGNAARVSGRECLMDFDLISFGPREWDLLGEAVLVRRYGRPHLDYQLFARTYGFDVFSWPGFQNMVLVRELLATVFRMQADIEGGESARRLAFWKGEPSLPWRGF